VKSFLVLKDFFKENIWSYIWGIFWVLVSGVVQLIVPKVLGAFTDDLRAQIIGISDLYRYVGYLLVIALALGLSRYIWRLLIMGTSRKLEYHIRNMFFQHLQKLSPSFYNYNKTGDLMAHATNDISAVRHALGPGIVLLTDAIFITGATMIILLQTIDYRLSLLALLPLPFLGYITTKAGKLIHKRFKDVQESFAKLTDKTQESISGIRIVKTFVQEHAEIMSFSKIAQDNLEKNMQLVRLWGLFSPMIQFISGISFFMVLLFGGILVIYGDISLGDFVAFNAYLALLTWPIMALGWVISMLQRGIASMDRINKILNEIPDIIDKSDLEDISTLNGEIEFRDLTFSYTPKDSPVLGNINIKIPRGNTVAIIGKTGSGKSTLVNLLLKLYNVEDNKIFIDGFDINKIPIKTIRESIGYVPQDTFLFSASIYDNIAFAFNRVDSDKVLDGAKIAQIYDNVMDFPDGFDTFVGERGVTLSGGQKQRVSIARAIIKDPQILILDDSLSAVDTYTEEEILKGLRSIMSSRTSIIIAHRVSTVKNSNYIYVLDEGKVIEEGTHESLIQLGGYYHHLHQKQLLEEELTGNGEVLENE
jgi:ATP-binding cassette subfamily B protein